MFRYHYLPAKIRVKAPLILPEEILLIEQLKRVMTPLLDLSFLNPHGSKNLTTVKTF